MNLTRFGKKPESTRLRTVHMTHPLKPVNLTREGPKPMSPFKKKQQAQRQQQQQSALQIHLANGGLAQDFFDPL